MLEDAKEHFDIKRREYKDLRKELKALKQAFDVLNESRERLEEAHEKLSKAHKKLEKAHSSLLNEQNKKEHVVTCDKDLTCDIIDESFHKSIIIAPTNPCCSIPSSTSSSSDGFIYDASLMVENEILKKEVKKLNHILAKAYVARTACLCAWVAKGHLSTKRDWAIYPRKARSPLLITKLVL
jgi:glycine cleavage system protein P-like pyridoxal-binding family